ncbi:MAG: type II toxin-antitoxin system RelE/ParE family toxin [Pseudomonadales bacterium]
MTTLSGRHPSLPHGSSRSCSEKITPRRPANPRTPTSGRGLMPDIGPGVREIRIRIGVAWRVVYVANRDEAIYVLHAFQKKTQRTSRRDIAAIESALKEMK